MEVTKLKAVIAALSANDPLVRWVPSPKAARAGVLRLRVERARADKPENTN